MKPVASSQHIVGRPSDARKSGPAPSEHPQLSLVHTGGPETPHDILADLVATIGSNPSEELLMRISALTVVRLARCTQALIYRWDPESASLRLAASAPLGEAPVGEERYALGDGMVGRAALAAEPVVSGAHTAGRPGRTAAARQVPMLAARIATNDGALIGVVGGVFDGAIGDDAAILLAETAALTAVGVERITERASARRRGELLDTIAILAQAMRPVVSSSQTLAALAALGLRATHAHACAIYVTQPSQEEARLAAVAPPHATVPDHRATREVERSGGALATEPVSPRPLLAQPIVAGIERLGTLVLFDDRRSRPRDDEVTTCAILAETIALALRQRALIDATVERARSAELLWEIVGPGRADPAAVLSRAQRMGCALTEAHVVIVATAVGDERPERLRAAIAGIERGAIVDVGGDRVVAIVSPSTPGRLPAGRWSIGVSLPCTELARYPVAYRQAQDTLELGTRLFTPGRIVRFDELGSYRFVPALLAGGLRGEPEYEQVSRLTDELLRTLEAYLDSGGNTALAAKQLYLHRNTLRQRLDRIA